MPFELKSPTGLWLLTLLAPLILFYILKVRRKQMKVASTWLWAQASRDLLAKSPFKKLVVQIPLILQLLALVLLAFALSSPATRGGAIVGDHVAVIIDTSASMSSRAGKQRRIDLAKAAADKVVKALSPGSDALIIEAAHDARVASPLDRDRRRLESAIAQLDARDVEGRVGVAIGLASDRLRGLQGDKRIVLITDGALAHPGGLTSGTIPMDVITVGSPVENAGIVRVDVRSGIDKATEAEQAQAFAVVANYGTKKREVFVTLRQRNVKDPIASRKLLLEPGERTPVVLTFEPTRGDRGSGLIVELSPPDAMPADDRAYGRVPLGRKIPVVMAPKSASPWFQRALLADPDVELLVTSKADLATAEVPPDALMVVDGFCPEKPRGADLVVLNPPAGRCYTSVVGKTIERPAITSWSESDARLQFLTLDGVQLESAKAIETDGPADSLVRAREGTVISDISMPGRSATLLSFKVGDSNWPLKASFVLFVRNIVESSRTHRARGITGPARTGETMRARVPTDVKSIELERPTDTEDTKPTSVPARNGLVVIPSVERAGFYQVAWKGRTPGNVLVAANLTSPLESDARAKKLATAGATKEAKSGEIKDAFTDWTWLVAALALLLVAFDAWWLTRRPKARATGARPTLPLRRQPADSGASTRGPA